MPPNPHHALNGKARPHLPFAPVDPFNNADDFQCCLLAALGFSNACVIAQTGLSPGQISYRLRKFQIHRADFRNGVSPIAEKVLHNARRTAGTLLERRLRELLKANGGT